MFNEDVANPDRQAYQGVSQIFFLDVFEYCNHLGKFSIDRTLTIAERKFEFRACIMTPDVDGLHFATVGQQPGSYLDSYFRDDEIITDDCNVS